MSPHRTDFETWPQERESECETRSLHAAKGATSHSPEASVSSTARGFSHSNDTWPEPKALPNGLLPVAAFEAAFLPEAIAPWVMDIAERMLCPADFIAIPAIVALGSVIGRKVAVRPQRKTDWYEVANLWGCIVGRPAAMKSPAMREALKPLYRLDTQAHKANEAAAKDYAARLELYKLQKGDVQKKVRKGLASKSADANLLRIDVPERPKARRYVVDDATYEALGEILADNPNGVLAFRDELVSPLKTLDREEYAPACSAPRSRGASPIICCEPFQVVLATMA
jgi:Protein of unknown function (DUF3987)